jgi:hypothetical protein
MTLVEGKESTEKHPHMLFCAPAYAFCVEGVPSNQSALLLKEATESLAAGPFCPFHDRIEITQEERISTA